jgi:2-methylisocitrate lyase-like PEP mutase family enzyme
MIVRPDRAEGGSAVGKVQEGVREVNVPLIVDGDTGYGSPMNVHRTVRGYVHCFPLSLSIVRYQLS